MTKLNCAYTPAVTLELTRYYLSYITYTRNIVLLTQCAAVSFVPSCKPGAPINVAALMEQMQASITWDLLAVAPSDEASDEGSPVLQYQIVMSSDGGSTWFAVDGCANNVSSFNKTGLTIGHTYYFKVSAQNAFGTSAPSAFVSVVPSNSPSAVKTFHIIDSQCGRVANYLGCTK